MKNIYLPLITIYTFLIFCCIPNKQVVAQDNSIIAYQHFLWLNSNQFPSRFNYEPKSINNYQWSLAYRRTTAERKTHQFEIKPFFDRSNAIDSTFRQVDLKFRYERGKYLDQQIFKVIDIHLGTAFSLNYLSENIESLSSLQFPTEYLTAGLSVSFFVHLGYKISEKFTIHLNSSFITASLNVDLQTVENPVLTENQQRQGGFDFDLGGERVLRLGVGYNL